MAHLRASLALSGGSRRERREGQKLCSLRPSGREPWRERSYPGDYGLRAPLPRPLLPIEGRGPPASPRLRPLARPQGKSVQKRRFRRRWEGCG